MDKISLVDLDKAEVLAALYNASSPQGMGFLHYDPTPMTYEEAEVLLKQTTHFDYLKGRVMKVDLSGDELNPWSYDRDNGQGAAESIIKALRKTGNINPLTSRLQHHVGTTKSAEDVKAHLHEKSHFEQVGEEEVCLRLGLGDMADKLGPIVDKVIEENKA